MNERVARGVGVEVGAPIGLRARYTVRASGAKCSEMRAISRDAWASRGNSGPDGRGSPMTRIARDETALEGAREADASTEIDGAIEIVTSSIQ